MQYAILIYETDADFSSRSEIMPAYQAYSDALAEAGVMTGGTALLPAHTATSIRLKEGQRQVQDGPFAETKEQLGGLYLIDVPDLDAALDWAARCPGASQCGVEVRPIGVTEQQ